MLGMVKPIGSSAFWADFHANVHPCSATWAFLFEERAAVYAVKEVSSFLAAFWAFEHRNTSLHTFKLSPLKL
jgi:hypothetical protein